MSGLTPQLQALPSGQDSKLFNITSFGGINYAENPFAASPSTASEMKNLYVNDEGTLSTRPRLQFDHNFNNQNYKVVQVLDLQSSKYESIGEFNSTILYITETDNGYEAIIEGKKPDGRYVHKIDGVLTKGQAYLGLNENNKADIYYTSTTGLFKLNTTEESFNWVSVATEPKVRRIYNSTDSVLEFSEINDENLLSNGYIDQAYFDPFTNYISPMFKHDWDISGNFYLDSEPVEIATSSYPLYYAAKKAEGSIIFICSTGNSNYYTFLKNDNITQFPLVYTQDPVTFFGQADKESYVSSARRTSFEIYYKGNSIATVSSDGDYSGYCYLGVDFLDVNNDTLYLSAILEHTDSESVKSYTFQIYKLSYKLVNDELSTSIVKIKEIPIKNTSFLRNDTTDKHSLMNSLLIDERNNIYFYNSYDAELYNISSVGDDIIVSKLISLDKNYHSKETMILDSLFDDEPDIHIVRNLMDIRNGILYVYETLTDYIDRRDDLIKNLDIYNLSTNEKTTHSLTAKSIIPTGYNNNSVLIAKSNGEVFFAGQINSDSIKPLPINIKIEKLKPLAVTSTNNGIASFYSYETNKLIKYTIRYKRSDSIEPNLEYIYEYSDEEKYDHTHPYVTTFDDKLWFYGGEGNIVRFTSDLTSSFLPKKNYDDIGDGSPITGMLQIANDYLGVFKSDTAYMITEDSETEDLYYVTNLKTKLGNVPQNQAIVTGLSNQSIVINDYGIYALGQSSNSVDTDTIFTSISEAINPKFVLMKDKEKIKTHNHRFLTYFYLAKTDSTDIWVYDNRNSAWYFWEFPISISTMVEVKESTDNVDEKLTKVFTNDGKVYDFTTALYEVEADDSIGESGIRTYRDFIGLDDYDKPLFKRIDWYWKSQPLTLNTINYLKKLNEATFIFADRDRFQMDSAQNIVIATSQQQDNLQLFYKFRSYRKKSRLFDSAYTNDIDYLYNAKVKPRIQKFDFVDLELSNKIVDDNGNIKYTYTGENDGSTPTDDWKDILDKLNLIGITFKYSLS